MQEKILVLDIDGTLTNSKKEITGRESNLCGETADQYF